MVAALRMRESGGLSNDFMGKEMVVKRETRVLLCVGRGDSVGAS